MVRGRRISFIAFQSTPPVKAATATLPSSGDILAFQSTPPVKAATIISRKRQLVPVISIHAAREGGDQ